MRVVVLSDTHLRPGTNRRLPAAVYSALEQADAVLHAGDVVSREFLDELSGFAPVHAVLGNNDHDLVGTLPERRLVHLGGARVAMVHDSGATAGRAARVQRWFPTADVVVFGHSHQPVDEQLLDGPRLFNPGSATERRRAPTRTYGVLEVEDGRVVSHAIVPLHEGA
jgi:putative phosphoesterase